MVVQFDWLLDFCRFYQGEDSINEQEEYKIFWSCERAWVRDLCSFSMDNNSKNEFVNSGLSEFCLEDGVPISLKAYIFRCLQLSSNDYKKWYVEKYLGRANVNHISKGKIILNHCRLAFLEYQCDKINTNITPEMLYMFEIANAVSKHKIIDIDAVVTIGWNKQSYVSIDEELMCKALSHAEECGLKIEMVRDSIQKHKSGFLTYHIEFKEIRERAVQYLVRNMPNYDDVEYIGRWKNKYVYKTYNEDFLEPQLWPTIYLLLDNNTIEEFEDCDHVMEGCVQYLV